MQLQKIVPIIPLILIFSLLYFNCTPSSYSLRYKDTSGIKTREDSLEAGLIIDESDGLYYYSQVQDTSFQFQDWDDDEEIADDESEIDISAILANLKSSVDYSDTNLADTTPKERMLMEIIKYMNTPYKYGGDSQNGIDCSAFTQNVFSNSLNFSLLRSARGQFTQGSTIRNRKDLIFGDLVFFNTRRRVRPGHVGIYIGDNLFAHASSKKGVIISSLDNKYYSKRFMGGRRVNELFGNF
jgi:hypothetical protein